MKIGSGQPAHILGISARRPKVCHGSRLSCFRDGSTVNSPPRVHVLGLGSIGTFAAHSLAEIPNAPPVTLLLHRPSLWPEYMKAGKKITLKTSEGQRVAHGNFAIEVLQGNGTWHSMNAEHLRHHESSQDSGGHLATNTIENLILCTKATQTVAALRPLLHRIAPTTTILFLQNGAGMIEDANDHLFQDPESRPNYVTGVISHGVALNSPFNITHTGFAATSLGPIPRYPKDSEATPETSSRSPSFLLNALPAVPRFNAQSYSFSSVLQIQLEKLTVNAFCNPLCALADSPNKYLFTIPETRRALISEISSVILALPELSGVPGVKERFSTDALEATVNDIIKKTAETVCSMVWDLRAGRETEIQYINGYWVRRGKEVGVQTPINGELVAKIEQRTRAKIS